MTTPRFETPRVTKRQWSRALCLLLLTAAALATAAGATRELRVCEDPDNLPFSNDRLEGFENKIAEVIAGDLHATVQYTWFKQGRAFLRQTLNAEKCDVMIGAPTSWGALLTTKPYYTSSYVFVYKTSQNVGLSSFDDPPLRKLKIGLPFIGNDGANPPPAYALARRGLAGNVSGFPEFPRGKIIQAVAAGEIDVAVVWGPFAGYFAKQQPVGLTVTPVTTDGENPSLRFTYDISVGVRRGDTKLRDELEGVLDRRQPEIRKVLEDYGVPLISLRGDGPLSAKSIQ